MAKAPGDAEPEKARFRSCPFCTMQIPAAERVCPHCSQTLPEESADERRRPFSSFLRGGALPSLGEVWERYGLWLKAAVPAAVGVAVLVAAYGRWVKHDLRVEPNQELPIRVEQKIRGDTLVLEGTVENQGEDVPDLSLRSIGVVVEGAYRDGRRTKTRVFPKAPHRGEGALLHGETGTFAVEVPAKGLREVRLSSEVVDLGERRRFLHPFERRRR